jgi:hypothetical protein
MVVFKYVTVHAGWSVNDRRLLAEDTRFCRWPGQSVDGKKHADADQGKPAFPFEGASDVRMRTSDGIVDEQVILLMAAVGRAHLAFSTPDPAKAKLGDQLAVLWEWIKKNQLRREWIVELRKLAQFRQGDSPAVGILQVYWKEDTALQYLDLETEDLVAMLQQQVQEEGGQWTPELDQQVQALFADPAQVNTLAAVLQSQWPALPDARAAKVAKELQEQGEAKFPYPVKRAARPAIRARRLMEDLFVPENTEELQRGRVLYVREWFSAVELREKEHRASSSPASWTRC